MAVRSNTSAGAGVELSWEQVLAWRQARHHLEDEAARLARFLGGELALAWKR